MGFFDIFRRHKQVDFKVSPAYVATSESSAKQEVHEIPFDIYDVHKVYRAEPIIRQTVHRYMEVALRYGFEIKSTDAEVDRRVKKRIMEIETQSGIGIYELIRTAMHDFIAYGNAFFVFVRDKTNATGKPYVYYSGDQLEPIAAIFPISPITMAIQRNKNGTVSSYKQTPLIEEEFESLLGLQFMQNKLIIEPDSSPGKTANVRVFGPFDVAHFKYDYDPKTGYGRPFYLEALDDLYTLRKLEDIMIKLIKNNGLSMLALRIGNQDKPANDTLIKKFASILQQKGPYDLLLVPEYVEVLAEHLPLLRELLEFYTEIKIRVFGDLGLSPVAFGEPGAANRATADTALDAMYDKARDIQKLFAAQFERSVLEHIVFDLGYKPDKLGDAFPQLIFAEPDIDKHVKLENHAVFKYEHSAITEDEMRKLLGKTPIDSSERKKMYIYKVKIPAAVETQKQINNLIENAGDTENRIQPQNQHTEKE